MESVITNSFDVSDNLLLSGNSLQFLDLLAGGLSLWVIVLVILLAVAVYFMKNEGILS